MGHYTLALSLTAGWCWWQTDDMENTGRQYPKLPVADTAGDDEIGTPVIASGRGNASGNYSLESIYNLIPNEPKKEKVGQKMVAALASHVSVVATKANRRQRRSLLVVTIAPHR